MLAVRCAGVFATSAALLFSFGSRDQAPIKITRATRPHHHRPADIRDRRHDGSYISGNWGGYAVTSSTNGAVTSVSGSWVVPAATCSAALDDTSGYAAFWVGIDGFSSNTVEQTGTDSDCVSENGRTTGVPTYYAWFEFYPADSYYVEFTKPVAPGDQMTATVTYSGQSASPRHGFGSGGSSGPQFTVTITDVTKNETYSTTSVVAGALQTSAEWIAEAPCCTKKGGNLPLSDFGTVTFSSGSATVSGTAGSTGSFGTAVQSITMQDSSTAPVKAVPSAVNGGGFSMTWENAGP